MKRTNKQIVVYLIILSGITSCWNNNKSRDIGDSNLKSVAKSKFAKTYPHFNPENFKNQFRLDIENDSDSTALSSFYGNNNYEPIWINDTLNTERLYSFINIIDHVYEHGLESNLFDKDAIQLLTDSIDSGVFSDSMNILYRKINELEKRTTRSLIKYTTGMKYGFINPKKLYKKDHAIKIATPDSSFYAELYQNIKKDPVATMIALQPQNRVYKKMQEEYATLSSKKDLEWKKIKDIGNDVYKIGASGNNITAIAKRLIITGEYTADTTNNDTTHMVLDEKLMLAVNEFRRKISYPEEPEIGSITIEALNRPLTYYIGKIKVNMERYRWQHVKERHDKHIDVIIPAFKLIATQKDSLPLIMRVCVGTSYNKTPFIESNISYLNLNPVWNVPKSIAQGEVSVRQKRDPSYLKRNNMKLFKNGKEVDPETINWQEVNPSKFNYYIRQGSGWANSLGRIKFMFNNDFSVYLHDTPVQKAFLRKNRAVSHGCVRVQRPVELAFFCLTPPSNVYKDQLRYSIDRNPETVEGKELAKENKLKKLPDIINPKDGISLSIDYYTVYMHPNEDDLYYADDVYDYDPTLMKELAL